LFAHGVKQLKDLVKLIAWKSGRGHDKAVAASCHRKDFHSLLRSFMGGATLKHDDLQILSVASKSCMLLLLMMMMMMMMMMSLCYHFVNLCRTAVRYPLGVPGKKPTLFIGHIL